MTPATVLIVEDDENIRDDLAQILSRKGYSIATAAHGADALAYLRASPPPCVVVLDLMMPVMDGWTLRLEMLKDLRLGAIPVVLVSGAGSLEKDARALGVVDFVSKPFRVSELLAVIARHC